jgi:UDP-N-acetylglucosamine:LPS N-acetylglucosamine transferase
LRDGFRDLMRDARPDLVISVLPVINGLLAEATKPIGARLEVVLTDWHSVHPFWQGAGVDHYTAPTESARNDCIGFGVPPADVDVVGIPVRREFTAPRPQTERAARLHALNLDPTRFTVLAMVGAEGSPRALRNLERLATLDLDAQVIVVCGHNDELRRRVERLPARVPIRALGFVEDVANLMSAADVLVTKAGGVTLAEAFCRAVPVVIHDVLPGQESGNLEYVMRCQAVVYASTQEALGRVVSELKEDPNRRSALAARGAALARPGAGREIAGNLLRRLPVR